MRKRRYYKFSFFPTFFRRASFHRKPPTLIRIFFFGFLLLIGIFGFVTCVDKRLQPIVEDLLPLQIKSKITNQINQTVSAEFAETTYDTFVQIEKDNTGKVTSVVSNVIKMNQLKSELSIKLVENMQKNDAFQLKIPLGSLFHTLFLSGKGFAFSVRLTTGDGVTTNFENRFSEAGMNQTLHQILLHVRVEVIALLPRSTVTSEVTTTLCIAETVIVGAVPNAYTKIDF